MTRTLTILTLIVCSAVLVMPLAALAEFYQYEDDNGTVHFVDDPGRVPKKYQKRQKMREGGMGDTEGNVTRVSIIGDRVLVPVTLAYRGREVRAEFVLDTGATTCTISPGLARRLGIDPSEGQRTIARGVGGGVYLVASTRLDYIVAGPNRKYDLEASVIESTDADGLLGMNFLRELRYHVDFHAHTITWGD